jgi:hypothetical protein
MSAQFFTSGLQLAAVASSGDGNDTTVIKAQLLRLQSDVGIKVITAVTNASPMVVTATAHGFANGDVVVQGGILGNLAANGTFKIANVTANTYELQTLDGVNTTGSAAYVSGGWAVDMTIADFIDDLDAGAVGTDQTLASVTQVAGSVDATDPTWTGVANPGSDVIGVVFYKSTGTPATSPLICFNDGRIRVVCAAVAATSATTVAVEKLDGPLPSGTALVFSNGVTATLSAAAAEGDRTLTVTALAAGIAAGHAADGITTGALLPVTPNGGSITIQLDNGVKKAWSFLRP